MDENTRAAINAAIHNDAVAAAQAVQPVLVRLLEADRSPVGCALGIAQLLGAIVSATERSTGRGLPALLDIQDAIGRGYVQDQERARVEAALAGADTSTAN